MIIHLEVSAAVLFVLGVSVGLPAGLLSFYLWFLKWRGYV